MKKNTKPWLEAMDSNFEIQGKIGYYEPIRDGTEFYQVIDNHDYEESNQMWKNSIYAYMAGKRPYFIHFNAYIKRVWKPKGSQDIFPKENGFYLIKIEKEEDYE